MKHKRPTRKPPLSRELCNPWPWPMWCKTCEGGKIQCFIQHDKNGVPHEVLCPDCWGCGTIEE